MPSSPSFCLAPALSCRWQLALDEVLLERCEASRGTQQWVRTWEAARPTVVVGRAAQLRDEVDQAACRRDGIEVLRRCTGGGAVVLGPGCLVYSVVLSVVEHPFFRDLSAAHGWILQRVSAALGASGAPVAHGGTSDLVQGDRKVSGNAMKLKRYALLYHGTVLYDAPLTSYQRWLHHPPREPEYRRGRAHADFVANLRLDRQRFTRELSRVFAVDSERPWPREEVEQLVADKYGRASWHEEGRGRMDNEK